MSEARLDRDEPAERMARDTYRAWADGRPGRYERINGVIVAMAPERAGHNLAKANIRDALRRAITQAGLSCQAFADGMTLEIDDSDFEPDCVVRCGATLLPLDAIVVPDPLVVVEVLSPSTSATDRALKLREYFRLPSVRHYLIVWPDRPRVVHHRRTDADEIETLTLASGPLVLTPPGVEIQLEDIYAP